MIEAGKLRNRLEIQHLAGSPSHKGTGEPATVWTEYATVWAAIRPLGGRELFLADQAESKIDAEIEIRYLAGVTAGMRAVHGSVIYNIEAVINPEARNERLILRCSTGLNQG